MDDPSDEPYPLDRFKRSIDRNGANGGDNRGRLGGNVHQAAASAAVGRGVGGAHGRLRAVNGIEELGAWGADGAAVEAEVKELIIDGVAQVDGAGDPILIAEVDLLTTFAPGDNFRVLALPERQEGLIDRIHVTDTEDAFRVPTNSDKPALTPQLTIWRHLYVENDSTQDVSGLMGAGVTRQTNRYADAFIEPDFEKLDVINTGAPAVGGRALRIGRTGIVHADDVAAVNAKRQSADLESNQFWVSYITDAFAAPAADKLGYTSNAATAGAPFQISWVFMNAINALPQVGGDAAKAAIVANKVAVHEIGHQFLKPGGPSTRESPVDNNGHRGRPVDITTYLALDDADKHTARFLDFLNVMNSDAPAVPMDNPATGPIDWFYFHPSDLDELRRTGRP